MIVARRSDRTLCVRALVAALVVAAASLVMVTPAWAAIVVDRVSTSQYGVPSDLGASSLSVSQDGRWAVFESATQFATNGYVGGTNIYLRDRQSPQSTYCVTRGAAGPSHTPAISGDGNYIVFVSDAPTSGAPAGTYRVKRTDVTIGSGTPASLQRVDVVPGLPAGDWTTSNSFWYCPSISYTGQYVAFVSGDITLPGASTTSSLEVYRRDMNSAAGTAVVMASVGDAGEPASRPCRTPSISADGSRIVFATGSALVASDTDNVRDIYLRDLGAGATTLVSAASPSAVGTHDYSDSPVISADGNVVAFTSLASDLVADDTNGLRDVFVRNLGGGVTTRVDVSATGAQTTMGDSFNPGLSPDGRCVSFQSACQDLGASPGYYAVYLRDVSAANTLVPLCATGGQDSAIDPLLSNGYTNVCGMTTTGPRYVAFDSSASTLTATPTNGLVNAFVVDRFPLVLATMSTPKLSVTSPRRNVYFYVSGSVSKDAGKAPVQLKFYRYAKVGGAYKYVPYKTFTTYTAAGSSSYKAKIKLPYTGSWYVQAFHGPDTVHLASKSAVRYFKVRT